MAAFLHAVRFGNTAGVEAALAAGVDVNRTFSVRFGLVHRPPALYIASDRGYTDVVAALLRHPHINVNAEDDFGCRAIMVACTNGHAEIVRLLLGRRELDVNHNHIRGKPILMHLLSKCHSLTARIVFAKETVQKAYDDDEYGVMDVVQTLTRYGPFAQEMTSAQNFGILYEAFLESMAEVSAMMKMILRRNDVSINKKAIGDGASILHCACRIHHPALARVLLRYPGIDFNAGDDNGFTGLHLVSHDESLGSVASGFEKLHLATVFLRFLGPGKTNRKTRSLTQGAFLRGCRGRRGVWVTRGWGGYLSRRETQTSRKPDLL